ncbi:MAG: 3-isopropylmalate dehydratase [Elusimicrobia bacterium RIFOXYB2_FULL_49_7]|nr:MAG: 3-isopropylmalate dehydratase [Elusimicrobia bacterium RIFOXYB2_FULL_49_7]
MKNFSGKVLFLDRSDINTDEIIPAKYLTEITKEALKPHTLEDLELTGFNPGTDLTDKAVVVTRANFGCGSSREHAPWALEVNGIHVVIAESFARIFRQNMFNGGMLAIELPKEDIDALLALKTADTQITVSFEKRKIRCDSSLGVRECAFTLSEFDAELVKAGGWLEYADTRY